MGFFDFWKKKDKININEIPPELQNIAKLLEEVKNTGTLPFKIDSDILENLKIIANTPNWHLMLHGEIINNLNKIYAKWQNVTNVSENVVGVSQIGGFEYNDYWQGTYDQYKKAKENKKINKNTKVNIIEYTGIILVMDEDGQMEEYME